MAFCVIYEEKSQEIGEKLSSELDCEPKWGEVSAERQERAISKADLIVVLIDDKTPRDKSPASLFDIQFNVARDRQLREKIKLLQLVLWNVTEEQFRRRFPFFVPGLPSLYVAQSGIVSDKDISEIADKIRSRKSDATTPLCSPLLVHLNAYEGASPWNIMRKHHPQAMFVELCKPSDHEYQASNRHPRRYWDIWKMIIDDEVVHHAEQCAKYDTEVHITGVSPLSLYMYLGMRLNRIPIRLWHIKTMSLGDSLTGKDTTPDIYHVSTGERSKELLQDKLLEIWEHDDSKLPQQKGDRNRRGRIAILVTLNRDHELSKRDLESMAAELKEKPCDNSSIVNAFVICPRTEGRIDMDVSNFGQIRLEVHELFQQCLRRVSKDNRIGLNLVCTGPTPLSFYVGTLIHPHIHGDVWCMEYQNGKYVAALNCNL